MFSEEPKLDNSEENINQPSGEAETSSPQAAASAPATSASASSAAAATPSSSTADSAADEEEPRPAGDVDFGQLLDQFEQEQASLQEGEVVRGIVVGISDRGVVIDSGYKS